MGLRTTIWTAIVLAFSAGTVVSFFTLPMWVTFYINVAKDGSRSDWLGFSGAIVGAFATIVAGAAAWVAVRKQLDQLIRQNDHNLYDALRKRAYELNEEMLLIERVCSNSRLVCSSYRAYRDPNTALSDRFPNLKAAVDRFNNSVGDLQKQRGIWGSSQIQSIRTSFIEHCWKMDALMPSMRAAEMTQHIAIMDELDYEVSPEWDSHAVDIETLRDKFSANIEAERMRISLAVSKLESRLFQN